MVLGPALGRTPLQVRQECLQKQTLCFPVHAWHLPWCTFSEGQDRVWSTQGMLVFRSKEGGPGHEECLSLLNTVFFPLFLSVLGLPGCVRAFSSCSKWRLLSHWGAQASHCGGFSLWTSGPRLVGSVVVAHGLSCPAACGIFPGQRSDPCPLHWQADF